MQTFNDEELDPRIEKALTDLNQSTIMLNNIENEIIGYKKKWLTSETKRVGIKHIKNAQKYYELFIEAGKAKKDLQTVVAKYDEVTHELKETKKINVELENKMNIMHQLTDEMQQEFNTINNKISDLNDIYKETETLFHLKLATFNSLDKVIKELFVKNRSAILKSKQYYYFLYNEHIKNKDQELLRLCDNHKKIKNKIHESMSELEAISFDIHERRHELPVESNNFQTISNYYHADDTISIASTETSHSISSDISSVNYDDFEFI